MFPKASRIWSLLYLFLVFQMAAGQRFQVRRRDAAGAVSTTSIASLDSTMLPTATGTSTAKPAEKTKSTSIHTTTSIINNPLIDNSTYYNVTIPAGQLPLKPVITPGWGVAGIIMILTGLVYGLVGIKNRYIHSFFSTAYITSLGVTVLIVYVMNVPISNAIQGGYVVAIIMSGCALGAGSMFFKELTEGFGCALGGFCIAMWLLCLVPGGLLQAAAAKAIFIAAFTLVGFAFYFSRWTRDWALIILIAIGGATVTVLGLDCYSRSGLKEFWAYVWNLNDNLFPLGAVTYPVTKGIRVETALIIIISLVGIISQIKLWRIVREQREKKAAERAAGQRSLEEEEEEVGRQIEEQTARERAEWERVYGEGTVASGTVSRFSDAGDIHSEKRLRSSHAESTYAQSRADGIEMADMSDSNISRIGADGLMSAEKTKDGQITVRVAADEIGPDGEPIINEKAGMNDGKRSSRNSKRTSQSTTNSKRGSRQQTVSPTPDVVPLPFKVPEDEDAKSQDDRSSVATFADEEEGGAPTARHRSSRHSLVKRLSRNSAELLRGFSQLSKQAGDKPVESGESEDGLVETHPYDQDDDRTSLAVTVDHDSSSSDGRASVGSLDHRKSIEITAELGKSEKKRTSHKSKKPTTKNADRKKDEDSKVDDAKIEVPAAADTPEETPSDETAKTDEAIKPEEPTDAKVEEPTAPEPASEKSAGEKLVEAGEADDAEKDKPEAVTATSPPVTLTKDRLPRSLSKVALSYRTNEWAKHLSQADAPEPDEIYIEPIVESVKASKELPRSVDVEDLQKTAEDGTLPPATVKRSDSQLSHISTTRNPSRKTSKKDIATEAAAPTSPVIDSNPNRISAASGLGLTPGRSSSLALRISSSGFAPIAEEQDLTVAKSPTVPEETNEARGGSVSPAPTQGESQRPPVPGVVSYSSPQTLLGQRETFLRNKSQGNLLSYSPEPTHPEVYGNTSDAGSLSNYPMYAAAFTTDPDDLPMNQRKEILRQSSTMSLSPSPTGLTRSNSALETTAENTHFNSHQPKRMASIPTTAAREARLANFRQSVQHELRSATPGIPVGPTSPFASTSNLISGIEMQRNVMIGQKEAEAQRREMQKRDKEYQDAMFDDRMRNGDLMDAHREVLRRMQNSAKD